MAATGALNPKGSHAAVREFGFYDIKGDVEGLLRSFNVAMQAGVNSVPAYYHPGRSVRLGDLVVFGELHADYARDYKMRHRICIAEFDIQLFFESRIRGSIEAVPRFPSIRRDLSLLFSNGITYAAAEEAVRS